MADVDDDAGFGSHFLDSMLEVEMTEEDGELDMSKNEDPLEVNSRSLPPIPTFDLQSETLSYKDVYRNSLVQPVLATLPMAPAGESVPIAVPVVQPPPVLAIFSPNNANNAPPIVPKPNVHPIQKPPKPIKPITKPTVKPAKIAKKPQYDDETFAAKFLQKRVFKSEYVKNVFTKQEPPRDLAVVEKDEMEYYKNCFTDVSKVQYCRLHCTICDKHLGCGSKADKNAAVHNMLKVLICKSCHEFYGDGNFPCDKGDNCEIYCRWCGQGGALVCCSFCPRVFCKKCLKRNFKPAFSKSIQKASDWACFCCAQKPLWPHRAICRALMEYMIQKKTDVKSTNRDLTTCCGISTVGRRKRIPDQNKLTSPPAPMKINPKNSVSSPNFKNKLILPFGGKEPLLKRNLQVTLNDFNKGPTGSVRITNRGPAKRASLLQTPVVSRSNYQTVSSSIYSTPQLIQAPVLHGETLITPPGSRMLAPKVHSQPSSGGPYVRVSLTNQTPNLDLRNIPTAKIPHDVQGLLLRLNFPDNRVQLVRLVTDGNGCKSTKDFPMPEFKDLDESAFIEENIAVSFQVSKMIYDKLMFIKDKVNSRTKSTEDSVFLSSVNRLHFVYEKSIELFQELDKSLLESYEEWKSQSKSPVDVVDLSEDEPSDTMKKKSDRRCRLLEKCKELVLSDDSDIEIIDDVANEQKAENSVLRDSRREISDNSNFKEKYRSTNFFSFDVKLKANPAGRKKKVGRRGRKRLKPIENAKKEEAGAAVDGAEDKGKPVDAEGGADGVEVEEVPEDTSQVGRKRGRKCLEVKNAVENGVRSAGEEDEGQAG